MRMQVVDTTDGRFIGQEFDSEDDVIIFGDAKIAVEFRENIAGLEVFSNSNYIIYAKKD
jgi:hypothetical protein